MAHIQKLVDIQTDRWTGASMCRTFWGFDISISGICTGTHMCVYRCVYMYVCMCGYVGYRTIRCRPLVLDVSLSSVMELTGESIYANVLISQSSLNNSQQQQQQSGTWQEPRQFHLLGYRYCNSKMPWV